MRRVPSQADEAGSQVDGQRQGEQGDVDAPSGRLPFSFTAGLSLVTIASMAGKPLIWE